jgi:hypothetical protein
MDPEMKYPRWQRPLEAAILEFDPPRLRAKLANAENIISERFQELAADMETAGRHELLALVEGLTIVRILEKDRMLVL